METEHWERGPIYTEKEVSLCVEKESNPFQL